MSEHRDVQDDFFGPHQHRWADPLARDREPKRFLDDPAHVRQLLWGFTILGVGLAIADLFFHRHLVHPWEGMVAFYPIFGLLSIVVLVYGAKGLRALMMRPESYYGDAEFLDGEAGEESGAHGRG